MTEKTIEQLKEEERRRDFKQLLDNELWHLENMQEELGIVLLNFQKDLEKFKTNYFESKKHG